MRRNRVPDDTLKSCRKKNESKPLLKMHNVEAGLKDQASPKKHRREECKTKLAEMAGGSSCTMPTDSTSEAL